MKRPRAARMARFRAPAGPSECPAARAGEGADRGSRTAQAAAMAAVASVEPSSARRISQSGKLWAATEAMLASRVAAAFQAGVMTETAGGGEGVMVRNLAVSRAML